MKTIFQKSRQRYGKFCSFFGYNGLSFHISIDIELYITQNMQFRLTFYIKVIHVFIIFVV